jgi:hypothetical protein
MKGAMPERKAIHWTKGETAVCGAPAGMTVSPFPRFVTCRRCIVALKLQLLERRLAEHRLSVAFQGTRRRKPRGE